MLMTFNSPIMMSLWWSKQNVKHWSQKMKHSPTLPADSQQEEDGTPKKASLHERTIPDVSISLRAPKSGGAARSVSNMGKLLPCGHGEGLGLPESSDFQPQLKGPWKGTQRWLQQGQTMEKQGWSGTGNTLTSWSSCSHLPFLVPSPVHALRGSPWGSVSQDAGPCGDGRKFLFCFGRSGGGKFANIRPIQCMFSFLWGLLTSWKTLNSWVYRRFSDCLECLFSLPCGLFQWPHLN